MKKKLENESSIIGFSLIITKIAKLKMFFSGKIKCNLTSHWTW